MSAYVEHVFSKGFLLDEEKLRKIVNIIEQRLLRTESQIPHSFKIFRADSYSYETKNLEDIIHEDNTNWKRIEKIEITANKGDGFNFRLVFSGEGTSICISGSNRDQVYLLFSDLREYLKNEVNICMVIPKELDSFIYTFFPMLMFLALIFLIYKIDSSLPTMEEIRKTTNSSELHEKLNFLIKYKSPETRSAIRAFWPMALILVLVPIISILLKKYVYIFFPSNLFLIGVQKQRYERRRRICTNVFWGIIIAFIIGILAGLSVWKMTK